MATYCKLGGKQAESCGGNIRRILIHETALGPEKLLELSIQAHKQIVGKRYIVCCEVDLGYVADAERPISRTQLLLQEIAAKLGSEFELKYYFQTQDDEALATVIRDPSKFSLFHSRVPLRIFLGCIVSVLL